MLIYVDQNYLIDFGTGKHSEDAENERSLQDKVLGSQHSRFVVSAWNMYETARAADASERASITGFVDWLKPLYVSNSNYIKQQELLRFLDRHGHLPFHAREVQAVNETVSRMWATYSGIVLIGESFGNYVEYLSRNEENRREIQEPASDAPKLIRDARSAVKEMRLSPDDVLIDDEWLFPLLPERTPDGKWMSLGVRKELLAHVTKDLKSLLEESPTIFVDELRYRYSVLGDRRIDENHAVDTQHILGPLSYCDYFLTADKGLLRFIEYVNSMSKVRCRGIRRLVDVKAEL